MILRSTGIILALDVEWSVDRSIAFLNDLSELIDAVKVGWYQLLNMGPQGIRELTTNVDKYFLADLKLGDVAHINEYVIKKMHELGINGVIMHAITGRENLITTVNTAHKLGVDIYLLVSMSSGGELYDSNLRYNVSLGMSLNVSGFIVPATKPSVIRQVRTMVGGGYQLLSPGIGVQGGKPGCAIANGADFEIIGRAIINSESPRKAALDLLNSIRGAGC
ncbi:orotidine 5'-phosphate decarboxylase / HUMPS family protein [Vulcanisaeta souniana]|uniref:Orotidine 5'-phosphate decarboxylase n=1 Tax=Vulcanisaeta souniana JCM 11219 TaxID=1293586 RepID=A0A830EH86_9CREN|nr:orotidine 5'-phosphate decarboxylase / HUMPS family protein [Vulcanisaeta souniana]BDR93343.1 orotidine-5'-phosphate decarboxylase [Vulcanisaeta souniana JCM 11219]GGI76388.1 orotidine-5'-phosphate decarboxylase [Vulcanisaeta souniana JCM 11219]